MSINLEKVPPYKSYALFPKSCACGRLLGCYQREIEESIIERMSSYPLEGLQASRVEVFKEFGCTMMCCLDKLIDPESAYISDAEGDAFVDITIKNAGVTQNNRPNYTPTFPTWGWLPVERNKVEFDENSYCRKMNEYLYGTTSIQTVINNDKTLDYPKFPKIVPTLTRRMPINTGVVETTDNT